MKREKYNAGRPARHRQQELVSSSKLALCEAVDALGFTPPATVPAG
jgi:hypothetical protein